MTSRSSALWPIRLFTLAALFGAFFCATDPAAAAMLGGRPPAGFAETFNVSPEKAAKEFGAQLIASSIPAGVLWPGDAPVFTIQFVTKDRQPLKAAGKVEVIQYGTRTGDDVFFWSVYKVADCGSVPIQIDIPAGGYQDVVVKPAIPEKFGAYALVVEIEGHGRVVVAGCVRTMAATPGKVQYPTYAMDAQTDSPAEMAMFQRLGIKGLRIEVGYTPTTDKNFYQNFARLAQRIGVIQQAGVTVMLTVGGGGPQPLGHWRPWLDDKGVMLDTKFDMAWLPSSDEDFQKFCKILAGSFGWPRGPVNAIELWNEPWEGISISGWGADIPRYRDIYTHMAQGIEEARKENGVKVLIGGTCSSMNTDDKLFCDGTDTFLKWLDFTSIHYQPMCAMPALIPEWVNRKGPYGGVRVWDTESWIANTEDRVAGVIASMRAQGQSRTAGVFHDAVRDIQRIRVRTEAGLEERTIVHTWAPGGGIAATNKFIGQREFKEVLFKNGLPWVFCFDGLPDPSNNKVRVDDGTLVVVGDLGGVYERDRLMFRGVRGIKNRAKIAEAKKALAALPADATNKERKAAQNAVRQAEVLEGAYMTIADSEVFDLFDFFGNPVRPTKGKIYVPLNGLGYFLRTDGSPGSFAKLVAAVKSARVDGIEPVQIVAHDLLGRVEAGRSFRLTLTNVLNRPVSGTLEVKLGNLTLADPKRQIQLAPNQTMDVEVKITGGKAEESNVYPLSAKFDAGGDGDVVFAEDLHVNVIAKRTIKVDGNLEDWKDILPQPIRSGENSGPNLTEKAWRPFEKFDEATGSGAAVGYLAYDDQFFYFAAKIADTTPYDGNVRFANRNDDQYFYPDKVTYQEKDPKTKEVKKTEELTWPEGVRHYSYRKRFAIPSGDKTDNVQIAFGVFAPDKGGWLPNPPGTCPKFMVYKSTDYEYALNAVADTYGGGTEIWRLLAPGTPRKHFFPRQPKAPVDGGPVTDGKLFMRRDGNTRIVEMALPWSELPEVKKKLEAGQPVRFTFRVNDNKGPSYELAEGRSVSKIDTYALHDYWATSWANEVEFAFEK